MNYMENLIAYIKVYAQHIIDSGKKVAVGIDRGVACVCFKDDSKYPYRIKISKKRRHDDPTLRAVIDIETYLDFNMDGMRFPSGAHVEIVVEDLFKDYFKKEEAEQRSQW